MINLRLPVIVCGKSITHLHNKNSFSRTCEIRLQCVLHSTKITKAISLALYNVMFHMLLRISLVLPVFLVQPTAKI